MCVFVCVNWATPEVFHGGFATGACCGAGPLLDHERHWMQEVATAATHDGARDVRGRLNRFFVATERGCSQLLQLIHSRAYQLQVPEEGAILVWAWLVDNGQTGQARALLDELAGFFDRFRLYPTPADAPIDPATVPQRSRDALVADLAKQSAERRPHDAVRQYLAERGPFMEAMLQLWTESLAPNERERVKQAKGDDDDDEEEVLLLVTAGTHFPEGWTERARPVLALYDPNHPSFQSVRLRTRRKIDELVTPPPPQPALDAPAIAFLSTLLSSEHRKRGLPGSRRFAQCRAHALRCCDGLLRNDPQLVSREALAQLQRVQATQLSSAQATYVVAHVAAQVPHHKRPNWRKRRP